MRSNLLQEEGIIAQGYSFILMLAGDETHLDVCWNADHG